MASVFRSFLQEDAETYAERKENIEELVAKTTEWEQEASDPSLPLFLEEMALRPSTEGAQEDSVRLMTLHNGKGLEFPLVFLVGMEEDLFPHINAKDAPEKIEEERRLCYVGVTRAKDLLFLTACKSRFLWGSSRMMRPSRFLKEIPSTFLKKLSLYGNSSLSLEENVSNTDEFSIGDIAFHNDFGQGSIRKIYQTSLGLTYDVFFFQTKSERTLVAKYAKLKRV